MATCHCLYVNVNDGCQLNCESCCEGQRSRHLYTGTWPHQLCLLYTTFGRTDICPLAQKSAYTRLLSSQFYFMQQKPGLLVPLTSKILKPSTWSVRDSCCRLAGNSSSEMTRLQRPPACRQSRKLSATVVAPSSVTLRDYKMSRRTRPSTATSTCLLVDHPTISGNVVWADHRRDGSTRSGRTMESPQWICGGVWRVVVTEEQRYGPRWLCDNDDDDLQGNPNSSSLQFEVAYWWAWAVEGS